MEEDKKKKHICNIVILAISLIALTVCVLVLTKIAWKYIEARKEYKAVTKKGVVDIKKNDGEKRQSKWINFDSLKNINEEVVAWIDFENEPEIIDYPIVQTKDNSFYLNHTFEKKKNTSACIFEDYQNKSDFSDMNTIIYGHNMNDKSMFAKLKAYVESDGIVFCKKNPNFYVYIPLESNYNKKMKFKIFNACICDTDDDKEPYKIFRNDNYSEEYKQWLENCKNKSKYDIDVNMDYDNIGESNKVVTLSTCTNNVESERVIVQGYLIETQIVNEKGEVIK